MYYRIFLEGGNPEASIEFWAMNSKHDDFLESRYFLNYSTLSFDLFWYVLHYICLILYK